MFKKIIISGVVLVVIAIIAVLYGQRLTYHTPGNAIIDQIIVIPEGTSAQTVAEELDMRSVIPSQWAFLYYLRVHDLRGAIKAGTYTFAPGLTIPDVATILTTGKSQRRDIRVTFPEGLTLAEMAHKLTEMDFDGDAFLAQATTPDLPTLQQEFTFLKDVPASGSLEGYLFPDTYFFLPEATTDEIIHTLLATFGQKFTPLLAMQNDTALQYNLHELVTMASIVEAEVRKDAERPTVAGLFYNRLAIDMALQSDATLDYIFGESKVKHTLNDTQVDSPYNTYQVTGLPPGPIGNPGAASLAAALTPQETQYLYFLNNATTGETVFAETFEEHVRNKAQNGL
jgi:UPF0755 protein